MTQTQRDAITQATANLFAAQDMADQADVLLTAADQKLTASQKDFSDGSQVMRDGQVISGKAAAIDRQLNEAIAADRADRDARFTASNQAHQKLDEADKALDNARIAGRQTNVVEQA